MATRTEPEALAANGWLFYEKCNCVRTLKYKYRNEAFPNLELQWLPKHFQFTIMNGNSTKVPLTKIANLDKVLKAL